MSLPLALLCALSIQVQNEVAVLWTGSDSKVTTAGLKLVSDQEAWIRTWFENRGDKAAIRELETRRLKGTVEKDLGYFILSKGVPEVNFKSQVVLAVFGGRADPAHGYSIYSTHREADTLVLQLHANGARAPLEPAGANFAKPGHVAYGFFVLPRNFKRVTVMSGIFEGVWAGAKVLGTLEFKG